MSRKLLVLDILLVALLGVMGFQFRKSWKASKARDVAAAHPKVTPKPVSPLAPIEPAPPVSPAKYVDVAQKDLFDPSRNPNVPVEAPPAPPPPPPPPPMPAFHGMMVLGSGPIAILSAGGGGHKATRIGEMIGPYRLTAIASDALTLEWNGQKFLKKTDELMVRSAATGPAEGTSGEPRTVNAPPPQAAPPPQPEQVGPGVETPYGIRTCNINDGLPEGTIRDGYRKVIYSSPFGRSCGWERAR